MKDQTPVLGEDLTDDGNLELEMKSESEIGAHLGNQLKGASKELVYAAELNASLKTLEGEINQIYMLLSEVDETKDFIERINNLRLNKKLWGQKIQFENEDQKLRQKLKVMIELYEENEVKLHQKLMVEEKCQLEEEERLCKVDKRISLTAKQLETYRKQAKDFEEELQRSIHFYERQIIFYENKACDDELAASTAERNHEYLRKVNAHNRQKLTGV
ncbi:cTAGE family member 5 [Sciurus carolinensis]|uniref:CTAGE family member 5 n=1 Tax=Sciurus carolinensis TaxID=30640 RepID=A0AA41MIW8_SCICA|nr:cTAGE family member 5 [Sciurus carolinensis]